MSKDSNKIQRKLRPMIHARHYGKQRQDKQDGRDLQKRRVLNFVNNGEKGCMTLGPALTRIIEGYGLKKMKGPSTRKRESGYLPEVEMETELKPVA